MSEAGILVIIIMLAQLAFGSAMVVLGYAVKNIACRRVEEFKKDIRMLSERTDFLERYINNRNADNDDS